MTYENLDFPVSSPLNASHGFLVQSACKKVVMGQCFAGTNRERNPYWQGGTSSLKMNSISFNAYGPWFNLGTCFDIVGNPRTNLPWFHTSLFNVDIAGNNSYDSPAGSGDVCQWEYNSGGGISPGCKIYRNGNIFINDYGFPFQTVINQMGSAVTEFASAIPELPLTDFSPLPTTDLEAFIYANVGARPLNRYPHDQRALDNSAVRTSTAGYISDQSQVGGYTSLSPTSRTLTIPGDPHFVTSSGYTNIELWAQQYAAALEPSNSSINQSRTLIGGIVR